MLVLGFSVPRTHLLTFFTFSGFILLQTFLLHPPKHKKCCESYENLNLRAKSVFHIMWSACILVHAAFPLNPLWVRNLAPARKKTAMNQNNETAIYRGSYTMLHWTAITGSTTTLSMNSVRNGVWYMNVWRIRTLIPLLDMSRIELSCIN